VRTDPGKELWVNVSRKEMVTILGCLDLLERWLKESGEKSILTGLFHEFQTPPLSTEEMSRLRARLRRNL
jgi:hypothetical protein